MTTTLPAPQAVPPTPEPDRRRQGGLLSTTPGTLRVESLVLLAGAVVAGLLAALVIGDAAAGSRQIADEAEPVIVSARQVQTSLAEANAAAATAFLGGGVENAAKRQAYEQALETAAFELEEATALIGDDDLAHESLRSMTADLPRYSGLIESARANNRQGFPVGAAYLDAASALLEDEVYPETDLVANRAAERYRDSYNQLRGRSMILGIGVVVLIALLVALLVYVQFQLRRRFNRSLNGPLLGATLVAVALGVWMAASLSSHVSNLTAARTDGYEGTRLYLDVRGTGFGAKADEARFLIARGAGAGFEDDFGSRAAEIDTMRAALDAHAADSADPAGARQLVDDTYATWAEYVAIHDQVITADQSGAREEAVALALGDADTRFDAFDEATSAGLASSQQRFDTEMEEASNALRFLQIGSILAAIAVAALALYGIQLRINEYR